MEGHYVLDDGREVDKEDIPMPELCRTCVRFGREEIPCLLTRMDQIVDPEQREDFKCFQYEERNPG